MLDIIYHFPATGVLHISKHMGEMQQTKKQQRSEELQDSRMCFAPTANILICRQSWLHEHSLTYFSQNKLVSKDLLFKLSTLKHLILTESRFAVLLTDPGGQQPAAARRRRSGILFHTTARSRRGLLISSHWLIPILLLLAATTEADLRGKVNETLLHSVRSKLVSRLQPKSWQILPYSLLYTLQDHPITLTH